MQLLDQKIFKFLKNNGILPLPGQCAHVPLFVPSQKMYTGHQYLTNCVTL